MSFVLHPRLVAGSYEIGILGGCHLRLKDNAHFPWMLVIPEVGDGIEDLHQLEQARFDEVTRVVRSVSQFVADYFSPEKLNVACIGNIVRQMHIHVVGRSADDAAWPGTVWACEARKPWDADDVAAVRAAAVSGLGLR